MELTVQERNELLEGIIGTMNPAEIAEFVDELVDHLNDIGYDWGYEAIEEVRL